MTYSINFNQKTLIINHKITNKDVFTLIGDNKNAFINYLKIQEGSIVNSETVEVKKRLGERDEDVLRFTIFDLRKKYGSLNKEVFTNVEVKGWEGVEISTPQIGDKKKLIDLSLRNALFYKKEKLTATFKQPNQEVLNLLMEDLNYRIYPSILNALIIQIFREQIR